MGILIQNTNGNSIRDFINALISQLQYVNDLFFTFYSDKKYEIKFTGQLIYMKRYLNDQFDPIDRRIYIVTNTGDISPFFYFKSEDDGPFIYEKTEDDGPRLQRKNESISDNDFTVWVPAALAYDSTQFNAAVNKYKLDDKTFDIQTF